MNVYEPSIPFSTVRDTGRILMHLASVALRGLANAVDGLRANAEPPEDLIVLSGSGGLYSGLLVVRCNEVIAGAVFHAGQAPQHPYGTARPSPIQQRQDRPGALYDRYQDDEPWG